MPNFHAPDFSLESDSLFYCSCVNLGGFYMKIGKS